MQQTEFDKLLAAPYAEFEARVRRARLRVSGAAGVDGFHAGPVENGAVRAVPSAPLRIEELVV